MKTYTITLLSFASVRVPMFWRDEVEALMSMSESLTREEMSIVRAFESGRFSIKQFSWFCYVLSSNLSRVHAIISSRDEEIPY